MVGGDDEERGVKEPSLFQHGEQPADAPVGLRCRVPLTLMVRAVVVACAVRHEEVVVGEDRWRVRVVREELQGLGDATAVDECRVAHPLVAVCLPARADVRRRFFGECAQPVAVADGTTLQHRVVGTPTARFVDGGGEGARAALPGAVDAVERLVQRLDLVAEELRRLELLAVGADQLSRLAQVVAVVDEIVVAAPAARADGVVAGPGDAG